MNRLPYPKDNHPLSSFLIWSRAIQITLYLIFSFLVIFYLVFTNHMLKITNSGGQIGFAGIKPGSVSLTRLESIGFELISDFGQVGFILITLMVLVIFYILTSILLVGGHQAVQEKLLSDLGINKIINENKFLKLKWSFLNQSFLILNAKKGTKVGTETNNLFWRIKFELIE